MCFTQLATWNCLANGVGQDPILCSKVSIFYVKYHPIASEILNREIFLYQNHRALDFHLQQGDNEVQGRFILVDNTLYKLTVIILLLCAKT